MIFVLYAGLPGAIFCLNFSQFIRWSPGFFEKGSTILND